MANFVLGSHNNNNNNNNNNDSIFSTFASRSTSAEVNPTIFDLDLASSEQKLPPLKRGFKFRNPFGLEEDPMATSPESHQPMILPQEMIKRPNLFANMDYQPMSLPVSTSNGVKAFSQGPSFRSKPPQQRHYKKDSRFVLDLYTLTFDEDERLEDMGTLTLAPDQGQSQIDGFHSLMPSSFSNGGDSSGPMSLGSTYSQSKQSCLPSLETNLHKILARKIQDSEEVSFRKAKLLTKAYYKLLRESSTPIVDSQVQVLQHRFDSTRPLTKPIGADRLSWQTLLRTEPAELKRTVKGLANTVQALNEYLVDLLQERDEMLGVQDEMLEEISEFTDSLL